MPDKMLTHSLVDNPQIMARSCRSRAVTMREIAAAIHDPDTRAALLRQASTWDEMATVAESRAEDMAAYRGQAR